VSALDAALADVEAVGALAAKLADESERLGHLHDDVVDAFHETGLFRILVPTELGGAGLTIPESVQVYRAMSAHDGSAGWLAGIIGNGPLFGMFVDRAVFEEVFGPARSVIAGSLNPLGGRAEPVPGGYRFNGCATNVSGCHEASWLMAGAWVVRDGEKSWVDGRPEMVAGMLPMSDATILDTWSTTGMRSTGSDDCTYVDVFVPTERTYAWPEPTPCWDAGPAARIPMHAQLGTGVAATVIGIAGGTVERFVELAGSKRPAANTTVLADRSFAHMALGEAAGLARVAEDALRGGTEDLWARAAGDEPIDDAVRLDLRLRMVTAARLSIRAIDLVHDAAGMSGVRVPSPLERGWRDAHTAVQHVLLSTGRLEVAGRVLLGRDPGSPVI
jgi:alkylation response protein AidB-like acyl-CoA dehydrogenase